MGEGSRVEVAGVMVTLVVVVVVVMAVGGGRSGVDDCGDGDGCGGGCRRWVWCRVGGEWWWLCPPAECRD